MWNRPAAASVVAVLAVVLLAGCSGETDKPAKRALIESQAQVYADRVLAEMRSSTDPIERANASEGEYLRPAIEKDGRAMCSHIIAGVPPREAFQNAYPLAPFEDENQRRGQMAADLLCPEQDS